MELVLVWHYKKEWGELNIMRGYNGVSKVFLKLE